MGKMQNEKCATRKSNHRRILLSSIESFLNVRTVSEPLRNLFMNTYLWTNRVGGTKKFFEFQVNFHGNEN